MAPQQKSKSLNLQLTIILILMHVSISLLANTGCAKAPSQNENTNVNKKPEIQAEIPADKEFILITSQPISEHHTNDPDVILSGRVRNLQSTVTVNEAPVEFRENGAFETNITLLPDENKIAFAYENLESGYREEKILYWTLDQTPPDFQIISLSRSPDDNLVSEPKLSVLGEFHLYGESEEIEKGVVVTANGAELEILDSGDGFTGAIVLNEGPNFINFIAKDPAGNIAEEKYEVTLDTTAPEIRIASAQVARSDANLQSLLIKGTVSEQADVNFMGRPVPVDEKGDFQHEIPLFDLETAMDNSAPLLIATDSIGNRSETPLPRSDYFPPQWVELTLVERNDEGAILEGKVNEPDVTVRIGQTEVVADKEGNVRLEGVILAESSIIQSELTDPQGNVSRVEQWIKNFDQ